MAAEIAWHPRTHASIIHCVLNRGEKQAFSKCMSAEIISRRGGKVPDEKASSRAHAARLRTEKPCQIQTCEGSREGSPATSHLRVLKMLAANHEGKEVRQ